MYPLCPLDETRGAEDENRLFILMWYEKVWVWTVIDFNWMCSCTGVSSCHFLVKSEWKSDKLVVAKLNVRITVTRVCLSVEKCDLSTLRCECVSTSSVLSVLCSSQWFWSSVSWRVYPPSPAGNSVRLSRVRWMPRCQREGRTSKHSRELTVLVGDPQGPVEGPLSFVFINRGYSGTERGRVHSWKGSCTWAWHFSYLHCLIVSVDLFMIFSPSLFVCGSFFSANALLRLPPSFYLTPLLAWYPAW